ncbi:hypothetical protein IT570_06315 [Candidatus Sumerlaeota bacterium]|nr:hypothetical protein [Candidatus Sumerlaeota bacterium]
MRLKNYSALLLVLLSVVVFTSGCTQQRAKNKLTKASQKVADIKNSYDGLKYEEAAIKGIEQKIDSANQQLAADASQALATAQQADAETEQVLTRVKSAHGNALYTQSEQEIAVARRNRLDRNDSVRFQKITEIKKQADEARAENKWEDVIKYARQVIDEVRIGIEPLKNEADQRQAEATQRLTELNREGGRELAPEIIIAVEDEIASAKKVSQEERDYNLATNGFQAAKAKADQGINQVLREKARIGIERIEGLLTSSVIEGVKQFKPEAYDRITKVYDELVRENEAGGYTRVITGVTNIEPEAKQLVIDTKRAASDDRIQSLQSNIKELEQGGILEYLPSSLDNLRASLAKEEETRKADDEAAFDSIKQMSIEASDEYDRVRGQFEGLANDRIREARNSVDKSRAVFEKMDTIFDPIEGPMDEDQQAFENQKQARKTQLGKQLETATDNLGASDLRKNQGNFRGAIVLAGEVRQLSEETLAEIYHTVAHNAGIELSKLVSRYERDGARVHAPEELARATSKLEQVKASVAQRAYQRAVEESAEARADVELLAQRIAGRAAENIRDANVALEAASTDNVRRFRPEAPPAIAALIQEASVDLQNNNLKLALEKAADATQKAKLAQSEADKLSADENLAKATQSIADAEASGAIVHGGRDIEDARRLASSSRDLYANQDYARADQQARSAVEHAQAGLYAKITEAEQEIATATSVGGWDNNTKKLSAANDKVREARVKLQAKQYSESSALADEAANEARAVAKSSKRKNFNARVKSINKDVIEGTKQGTNFFQVDESVRVRQSLAALKSDYSPNEYDRVMAEISKVEADFGETLTKTPEVVNSAADSIDARLNKLVEGGADSYAAPEIKEARDDVRYARLDYRRGAYRSTHIHLLNAAKLTLLTEFRRDHTSYSAQVQEIFRDYRALQLKFANVLSLDPKELEELAIAVDGSSRVTSISAQVTPSQFREGVEQLYSRALLLSPPASLEKLNEIFVASIAEGRLAGMYFERLAVLNRMSTDDAKSNIDQAYYRINLSNEMVTDIQRQLGYDQVRFRLARIGDNTITNSLE